MCYKSTIMAGRFGMYSRLTTYGTWADQYPHLLPLLLFFSNLLSLLITLLFFSIFLCPTQYSIYIGPMSCLEVECPKEIQNVIGKVTIAKPLAFIRERFTKRQHATREKPTRLEWKLTRVGIREGEIECGGIFQANVGTGHDFVVFPVLVLNEDKCCRG